MVRNANGTNIAYIEASVGGDFQHTCDIDGAGTVTEVN